MLAEPESKLAFLDLLQTLHEESGKKWRIRNTIAQHIFDYAQHYEPEPVFKKMWGLTMLLCVDDVSRVRESAAKQVWRIVAKCKDQEFISIMTSDVQMLAGDQKWSCRQLYTIICAEMWQDLELLESTFLSGLLGLCKDPAVGVRLAAAKSLKKMLDSSGTSAFLESIEKIRTNAWIQQAEKDLREDSSPRIKEVFLQGVGGDGKKQEEEKMPGELISEEDATKIDLTSIEKEIAQEGGEKKSKMPLGFKIDEIDI